MKPPNLTTVVRETRGILERPQEGTINNDQDMKDSAGHMIFLKKQIYYKKKNGCLKET